MGWPFYKPSRRALALATFVGAAMAALTIWFVRAVVYGPDADPGGRILHTLESAVQAIPGDAQVLYRNDNEPRWDSCDGRPGTFGWDIVTVQVHFAWTRSTNTLIQRADETLRRLGWRRDYTNEQATFIQVGWVRTIDNGTVAKAQLSNGVPDQNAATPRWDLFVEAPPVGPQSSGC